MENLGSMGDETAWSRASAINNLGQVAGTSEKSPGETHAFLWEDGFMYDLGTVGDCNSWATDINDIGQVVGNIKNPSSDEYHAVLWPDGTYGNITDLHPLLEDLFEASIDSSWAVAVNDARLTSVRLPVSGAVSRALTPS